MYIEKKWCPGGQILEGRGGGGERGGGVRERGGGHNSKYFILFLSHLGSLETPGDPRLTLHIYGLHGDPRLNKTTLQRPELDGSAERSSICLERLSAAQLQPCCRPKSFCQRCPRKGTYSKCCSSFWTTLII